MNDAKLQQFLSGYANDSGGDNGLSSALMAYELFKSKKEEDARVGMFGGIQSRADIEQPSLIDYEDFADELETRNFDVSVTNALSGIVKPLERSMLYIREQNELDTDARHIETAYLLFQIRNAIKSMHKEGQGARNLLIRDVQNLVLGSIFRRRQLQDSIEQMGLVRKGINYIGLGLAKSAMWVGSSAFKIMFGAKKKQTTEQKILEVNQKQLEFMMTGEVDQRKSWIDMLKTGGVVGALGEATKRGVLGVMGSGIDVAQQAEVKRSRGEELTFDEKRALSQFGKQIKKRGSTEGMMDYGSKSQEFLLADINKDAFDKFNSLFRELMFVPMKDVVGERIFDVEESISKLSLVNQRSNQLLIGQLDEINENSEISAKYNKMSLKEQIKTRRTIWLGKIAGFFGSLISGITSIASAIGGLGMKGLIGLGLGGLFSGGGGLAALGKFAKFIPVIGTIVVGVTSIVSGFDGWGKAAERFNTEFPTLGQKVASTFGSVLSTLTFGLLDAEETSKVLYSHANSLGEAIRRWILPDVEEVKKVDTPYLERHRTLTGLHGKEGATAILEQEARTERTEQRLIALGSLEEMIRKQEVARAEYNKLVELSSTTVLSDDARERLVNVIQEKQHLGNVTSAMQENLGLSETDVQQMRQSITIETDDATKNAYIQMIDRLERLITTVKETGITNETGTPFDNNTLLNATGS